ncbi:MAG TPA: phosphatidate cytidylyltransferase [Geminicoccaceae bacterium]|nr:phosphatidate cytidylyltransferase [Geminicoccaceae bacterium]
MIFDPPPRPVLLTLAGLFLVLVVASVAARLLRRGAPDGRHDELLARVRSWWVMVTIFAAALLLSRTAAIVLLGFVSFLALKEYLSLIPTRRADRRVLLWAYLAVPLQFYWIAIGWYGMFLIFVPIYMFLLLPVRMLMIGETQGFLRAVATLHWGLMTTVFSVGHAAYLLMLPDAGNPGAGGAGLLLYLVVLTEANDVCQYLAGRLLGRRKVIPKVSPNKTWEGLLGGVVGTTVLALLLAPLLTPFVWPHALLIGLLLGLAGFVGDITISAVKRDLQIKDTGTLLPGHGGIMDRIDSLTYTAPLFFHVTYYLHY